MKKYRSIKDISENGPFKFFEHHIRYLEKFKDWVTLEAISDIPTLNGVKVRIKKGEKSFYYRADDITIPAEVAPVTFQDIGYGFLEKFNLKDEDIEIVVPKGVNIHNLAFRDSDNHFGNINNLNTPGFYSKEKYYRTIIPIIHKDHNDISIYFETNPVKVDNWSKYIGLLNIDNYDIFEYRFKNIDYLIIDVNSEIEFDSYFKDIYRIIYCFALVSGNLYRDELFFFASLEPSLKEIHGFAFKEIEESIIEELTVIPYRFLKAVDKLKEVGETRISSEDFNKIVNKTTENPELLRCIKLLTEAANLPLELRTSIYSVCLETIRNIVQDQNKEKLNPFRIKNDCRKFIKESKNLLAEIPDQSFNNRETVIKRIENVNQLGNTESFTAVFKLLEIPLTNEDIECIKKRNDFLHGRLPFEDKNELCYIAEKFYQLCEYIILKHCGYSGIVLDQANLTLKLNSMPLKKDKFMLRKI